MPRPKCCRNVSCIPDKRYFKPKGIQLSLLEEVVLTIDEFEAVRLADLSGLHQDQAAAGMGISRQTFGRIIGSAHQKIADVLVNGKALRIEGGNISVSASESRICRKCHRTFNSAYTADETPLCPACNKQE